MIRMPHRNIEARQSGTGMSAILPIDDLIGYKTNGTTKITK